MHTHKKKLFSTEKITLFACAWEMHFCENPVPSVQRKCAPKNGHVGHYEWR